MVRVFVQKESCCSGEPRDVGEGVCSGPREVIDRERAEMAVKAVTQVDGDTNFNFNYNNYRSSASFSPDSSSQSSFCDSESDNGSLVISEEATGPVDSNTDVVTKEEKRKERRRERNKKSAQAYRQRRRQHSGSQVKTLQTLEGKNQELLQKVQRLEEEKRFIEELLKNKIKIPWHVQWALPPTWQHTTTPPPTTTGMMASAMGAPMPMGSEVTCAS